MNLKRVVLPAVALAVAVAVAWSALRPAAAQDKKDVPARVTAKWEYKVVRPESNGRSVAEGKMEATLNKLGEEGWECVGTVDEVTGTAQQGTWTNTVLICKRPRP
jgi:hypothetical protein